MNETDHYRTDHYSTDHYSTDHYIAGINQAIGAGRDDIAASLADEYAALVGVVAQPQPRDRHRVADFRAGRSGRLRRPAGSRR